MTEGDRPPDHDPSAAAETVSAADAPTPTADAPAPTAPVRPVASTRALLGTGIELLVGSSAEMRRASFYVGALVLGTVGPLVLAAWGVQLIVIDRTPDELFEAFTAGTDVLVSLLGLLASAGLVVAFIESRNVSLAIVGGAMAGRPVSARVAVARSRTVFWSTVVATLLVVIPVGLVQSFVDDRLGLAFAGTTDAGLIVSTAVGALVGAPLAYVLAGVVLGDVGPIEAVRRSVRVFAARKAAAILVAGFETIAALLILLGLGVGLDLILRVFDALGLGPTAGPVGLAITTAVLVVAVFAVGTLIYTVYALAVAPQAVMFVGLTHATAGLERVWAGARVDGATDAPGRPFGWFSRPMLAAFVVGAVAAAALLSAYRG